jgi:6-pyruvoyltetrahydropterin/6-carboxytetrahydropterin synthase
MLCMAFEISCTRNFSAAHALRLYDGSLESLHGHNWQVRVTVSSQQLDSIGLVMDFHQLERLIDEVISPMHNRNLNDLPAFASINPSAENVAVLVAKSLQLPANAQARLVSVEVWETPECRAVFRP